MLILTFKHHPKYTRTASIEVEFNLSNKSNMFHHFQVTWSIKIRIKLILEQQIIEQSKQ